MEIDESNTRRADASLSPEGAIKLLLKSNYDADSKECIFTLLKVIDNIIAKPNNIKVRTLKIENPTVQQKIISKKGGMEVLYSIGFIDVVPSTPAFEFASRGLTQPGKASSANPASVVLNAEDEDLEVIVSTRQRLGKILVEDLGVSKKDVPKPKQRPTQTSSTSQTKFDVFQTHSFNTQSAAVGAPNPNSIRPDGTARDKSVTEKQLEKLRSKQEKLERKIQPKVMDREIAAFLPGDESSVILAGNNDVRYGKGDASLLARHMKQREENRKKRDEGGFTTKAMRDLEKIKKSKVYSHAQIHVYFPDGTKLSANFLPSESITVVKEVIISTFLPELQSQYQFDLYVSPPRRILTYSKKLIEEGLVPAAKIYVSWKTVTPPSGSQPGSFLQQNLFRKGNEDASFPLVKPLIPQAAKQEEQKSSRNRIGGVAKGNNKSTSKEDALIQRMLGKGNRLGGKRGNSER